MQDKRRWLPRWQRIELVELCLERGLTRRQAAAWRRVSVSTVQYWVDRYRAAGDAERASGAWAQDRPSTPHRQPGRVSEQVHDRVCEARERTGWGPRLIASELGDGPRDRVALPAAPRAVAPAAGAARGGAAL